MSVRKGFASQLYGLLHKALPFQYRGFHWQTHAQPSLVPLNAGGDIDGLVPRPAHNAGRKQNVIQTLIRQDNRACRWLPTYLMPLPHGSAGLRWDRKWHTGRRAESCATTSRALYGSSTACARIADGGCCTGRADGLVHAQCPRSMVPGSSRMHPAPSLGTIRSVFWSSGGVKPRSRSP